MWNIKICGITHLPCAHCQPGKCLHRKNMCDGCRFYRYLSHNQDAKVCMYCHDGYGRTQRLPTGLCANYRPEKEGYKWKPKI